MIPESPTVIGSVLRVWAKPAGRQAGSLQSKKFKPVHYFMGCDFFKGRNNEKLRLSRRLVHDKKIFCFVNS